MTKHERFSDQLASHASEWRRTDTKSFFSLFLEMFSDLPLNNQAAYSARETEVKKLTDIALEGRDVETRKSYKATRAVYLQRIRERLGVEPTHAPQGGGVRKRHSPADSKARLSACNAAIATLARHYPHLDDDSKALIDGAISRIRGAS